MNNIDPIIWGPSGWKFMHYITLSYSNNPTSKDKNNIKNFFMSVKKVLPCKNCQLNFEKHLEMYPLNEEVLKNRESLVIWFMNIHNRVNNLHNKKEYTSDKIYNEYILSYNNTYDNYKYNLLIILLLILIYFAIKKCA